MSAFKNSICHPTDPPHTNFIITQRETFKHQLIILSYIFLCIHLFHKYFIICICFMFCWYYLHRDYVKQEDKQWIALYVQGFSDSPVSWTGREHHYYVNGDNSYVFVINSSSYLLCTQRCSNKRYK